MITFCVIDDHEVVHDGLRALAEREPDLAFVGAATTVADGAALVERARPDVVVVDLRIGEEGDGSGLELCRTIVGRPRAPAVVLFSAYGNRDLLARAIEAGASGYVLKETSVSRVPGVLREVLASGSWYEPRLASDLLRRRCGGTDAVFSARELEIVRGIGRGESNHDIGAHLHLSCR